LCTQASHIMSARKRTCASPPRRSPAFRLMTKVIWDFLCLSPHRKLWLYFSRNNFNDRHNVANTRFLISHVPDKQRFSFLGKGNGRSDGVGTATQAESLYTARKTLRHTSKPRTESLLPTHLVPVVYFGWVSNYPISFTHSSASHISNPLRTRDEHMQEVESFLRYQKQLAYTAWVLPCTLAQHSPNGV
jgi:hypothetical protein